MADVDANVSQGGHSWTDTFPAGYSGAGALEATPNNGTNNTTGYVTSSPRLDYTVNFVKTGVHYIWVRGAGPSRTDDSLHVGLDGAALTTSNNIGDFGTALGWINTQRSGAVATINVSTPGEHTLNVWMREDGTIFDKLVLTTNSGYTATGSGPPASPRGSATVAAAPVANPTGGTFTDSVSVSLTTTAGDGLIYYTTDGSDPDVSAALYSSGTPLVFMADTTLKAITIASGLTDSSITTQVYTVVPAGSGTGAIQQDAGSDGLLSIDVADVDANVSQGGHSWTDTFPAGYSGAGALEATPNNGTNNSTGYVTNSPRLDYTVNFVKTGVHYVWVRGAGPSRADDSLHVGLDGAALTTSNNIGDFGTALGWTNTQRSGTVVTVNVSTPGEHTLNVWMREDGMIVDKLVLTTNSGYTATGSGPPASPRGSATVAIQQDTGSDGLLSIDVADVDANVSQGGHSWTDTFPAGYSGAGALEATPNNGTNNSTGYVTNSPRLDYTVNFVKTGVHYIWVRGAGPSRTDDSLHVGLDGAALTTSNNIGDFGTALGWINTQRSGAVATINVSTPGEHTLNVWMREDGTIFDKLVLTTNSGYTATGSGPPASPR